MIRVETHAYTYVQDSATFSTRTANQLTKLNGVSNIVRVTLKAMAASSSPPAESMTMTTATTTTTTTTTPSPDDGRSLWSDPIGWLQSRIGSYDVAPDLEPLVQRSVLKGLKHIPKRSGRIKTELIDLGVCVHV